MTCEKCETTCEKCMPNHHRDMQTRRYNDIPGGTTVIATRLLVKLINDKSLDAETRAELKNWFVDN